MWVAQEATEVEMGAVAQLRGKDLEEARRQSVLVMEGMLLLAAVVDSLLGCSNQHPEERMAITFYSLFLEALEVVVHQDIAEDRLGALEEAELY